MPGFLTRTVGCKVNQYETQAVADLLTGLGVARAKAPDPVGLVVVNTCCVTSRAAARSRQAVRRAVRAHPGADVLVLGCYATRHPDALRRAAERAGARGRVHLVGHAEDVAGRIRRAVRSPEADIRAGGRSARRSGGPEDNGPARAAAGATPAGCVRDEGWMRAEPSARPAGSPSTVGASDFSEPHAAAPVKDNVGTAGLPAIRRFHGHQRAFVKVQDGCDAFCSYCIVPHLRRRVWSRAPEEVLAEVTGLVARGHKEVVLCGVCLGAYGQETVLRRRRRRPAALAGLLARVAGVPGLWRVRLSSLDAGDVADELLGMLAAPTVAGHLHLPLQSGSDRVLRRMRRQYTAGEFLGVVDRARRAVGDLALTTDVLVGFPGETEDDFAATLDVARRARFSRVHIFAFSPRPRTPAWQWRHEAPPAAVVRDRCRRLQALAVDLAADFRRRFVGRTVEALVERPGRRTPPGRARGLTDRYLEVTFPAPDGDPAGLAGRVVAVRITGTSPPGLTGTLTRS